MRRKMFPLFDPKQHLAVIVAAALFSVIASKACADVVTLSDASWQSDASVQSANYPLPNAYSTSNTSGLDFAAATGPQGYGTVTIVSTPGPRPRIFDSVNTSAPICCPNGIIATGARGIGNAFGTYSVEVLGPADSGPVLLDMHANLSANVEGQSRAYAALTVQGAGLYGPNGQLGGTWNYLADTAWQATVVSKNISQTYELSVNQPFQVSMLTFADAWAYRNTGDPDVPASIAIASADPYFSIDPSVPNADQYQILLSPGIGNSSVAAPGPAPGAGMLSFGFLMLAGLRTRRREIGGR
jgi:MYXO-CTERM domain-containing protein